MIGDRGSLVHKKWIYSNNKKLAKSGPQVKTKLNKWYYWLINHVPKPIKDGASKAFNTFKDKVMGLYNRVTGSTGNETRIKEPKPFKPMELEQAFGGAYKSYRVNGKPEIDVDTFFNRIRKELIELIKRELKTLTSAGIQTTAWIRFVRDGPPRGPGDAHDEKGQNRVELAFNSLMTSVYRGSDTDQIVDGMIANMKFQIENPALSLSLHWSLQRSQALIMQFEVQNSILHPSCVSQFIWVRRSSVH